MNIAWWVERWSELHPDKPAILFEGEQISYFELHPADLVVPCISIGHRNKADLIPQRRVLEGDPPGADVAVVRMGPEDHDLDFALCHLSIPPLNSFLPKGLNSG